MFGMGIPDVGRNSSICNGAERIPIKIISYLELAGFFEVAKLAFFQVEPTLISTLVECWRPETHTFHMP